MAGKPAICLSKAICGGRGSAHGCGVSIPDEHQQVLRRRTGALPGRSRHPGGRGALPGRRKRLGQVHPDQGDRGRRPAGPGSFDPDQQPAIRPAELRSTRCWRASRSSTRTCPCSPTSRSRRTSPSTNASRRRGCWSGVPSSLPWPGRRWGKSGRTWIPTTWWANLPIARQQIVAICRSITRGGKLIVMDEPTSSLGKRDIEYLFSIIRKIRDRGLSVLFVGHKLNEIFEIADRVIHPARRQESRHLRDRAAGQGAAHRADDGQEDLHLGLRQKLLHRPEPLLEVRGLSKKGQFNDVESSTLPRGDPGSHRPDRFRAHRAGARSFRAEST